MSLLVVAAVLVWLVVLLFLLALMAGAKRADDQYRVQRRRFVRSLQGDRKPRLVRDGERERERVTDRRAG